MDYLHVIARRAKPDEAISSLNLTPIRRLVEIASPTARNDELFLQKHRRPVEFHDNCTVWFLAPAFDFYNACIGSRLRFALLDDLAFSVDRIAVKDGMRMHDFVIADVCDNCTFG